MDDENYKKMSAEMEVLIKDRGIMPDRRIRIETRMVMILPKILPVINDMKTLIFYWENTDASSKPEALIQKRVIGLIRDVSADTAVPEWFIAMVRDSRMPAFMREHFDQKVEELLRKL